MRRIMTMALLSAAALSQGAEAQRAGAPVGSTVRRDTVVAPVTWRPEQLATLAGTVTDSGGRPVPFASILADSGQAVLAQSDGNFRLGKLRPGPNGFLIRRIGYQPLSFEIEMPVGSTVNVNLKLIPASQDLKAVVIEGKRVSPFLAKTGFYDRQRQGLGAGIFFDPEEIKKRALVSTVDIMRGLPSIVVSRDGPSITRIYGRGQRCMEIYVDGAPMGTDFDLNRNMPPEWVKAIEIYSSANNTPPQFSRVTGCGAVVVWTRVD